MYKFLILLALMCPAKSDEGRGRKYVDPFVALDRHLNHALAYHYFWPWARLAQAAAAMDVEESLEEPQIISEPDRFQVNVNVKRYKPDELRIKVKNRYIIVEGKHNEKSDDKRIMANHFVQRFVLPTGSKSEEVTAVLKQNGVLSISAPRHELPPPPPEREVPIKVLKPEEKEDKNKDKEDKNKDKEDNNKDKEDKNKDKEDKNKDKEDKNKDKEDKNNDKKNNNRVEKEESTTVKEASIATSSASPVEQQDLVEATTHVGKIRKKELKTATKETKDNEVMKGGEDNGLDYSLVEPVE